MLIVHKHICDNILDLILQFSADKDRLLKQTLGTWLVIWVKCCKDQIKTKLNVCCRYFTYCENPISGGIATFNPKTDHNSIIITLDVVQPGHLQKG